MTSSLQTIVNASRGYDRPEQVNTLKQNFGGKNHGMIAEMQVYAHHKKMNECAVNMSESIHGMTDEIVSDVRARIHAKIAEYYQAPASLLTRFSVLDLLFSGEKAEKVANTIRQCINAEDTNDSLEQLGKVSDELETMIEAIRSQIPTLATTRCSKCAASS